MPAPDGGSKFLNLRFSSLPLDIATCHSSLAAKFAAKFGDAGRFWQGCGAPGFSGASMQVSPGYRTC
jgi:hypothetical protein